MAFFLSLLIGIPFLEIVVLIKLGQVLGLWNTLLLLILIGFLGTILARLEGLRALINLQVALERGEMPGEAMVDGFLIFVAGIFLVFPGFLSDVVALGLLIPWTRYLFKRWLRKKFDEALRRSRAEGEEFHYRFLIR